MRDITFTILPEDIDALIYERVSMFDKIKPGHILRFGTDPDGIDSPNPSGATGTNDNSLETLWPNTSSLGRVRVLSHPSGTIGPIAADVAKKLRSGFSPMRMASYSPVGLEKTQADREIGYQNCDFVGYTDGKSHYINSDNTVFSKDFTGCTMVVYKQGGVRRVAHSAASPVPHMNCRHAFMTTLQGNGAALIGWFKPYVEADNERTSYTFSVIQKYIGGRASRLTTFGVITSDNLAYSLDAFKPSVGTGFGAGDWVVTCIARCPLDTSWVVP